MMMRNKQQPTGSVSCKQSHFSWFHPHFYSPAKWILLCSPQVEGFHKNFKHQRNARKWRIMSNFLVSRPYWVGVVHCTCEWRKRVVTQHDTSESKNCLILFSLQKSSPPHTSNDKIIMVVFSLSGSRSRTHQQIFARTKKDNKTEACSGLSDLFCLKMKGDDDTNNVVLFVCHFLHNEKFNPSLIQLEAKDTTTTKTKGQLGWSNF